MAPDDYFCWPPGNGAGRRLPESLKVVTDDRPERCACGYIATSAKDLDEHILASMHLPGDHGGL